MEGPLSTRKPPRSRRSPSHPSGQVLPFFPLSRNVSPRQQQNFGALRRGGRQPSAIAAINMSRWSRTSAEYIHRIAGGLMVRARLGHLAANVLMVAMLVLAARTGAEAQGAADVDALNKQVVQLAGQGKYKEAVAIAEKALALAERVLGPEHPETLSSLNNLAAMYQDQGRHGEAEPLYKRALEARERVLGKEHPKTLTSVNNLADLYRVQGRFREAEALFKRALEADERVLGKEHPDTLVSVNNLAFIYQAQGRYSEAEPLYKRALAAYERVRGPEHPDTLTSVNNLGFLYLAQGRYSEAEPLYKRALAARERVLGSEHPDTLTSVNNLAGLYQAQGRYSEAEPLYKRALAAYERVRGPEHPDTLTSVNNLAGLYQAQGRYSEAEPLYKRALAAYERVRGPEHPDTLTSVNNLAGLYHDQGRSSEAEPLYKRALAAREHVLGPEHPQTLGSMNNLAFLYYVQGLYGDAEPLFRRVLAARERLLGPGHPDTLLSVNNLAALYDVQGRYSEAEPLYKRALAARERVLWSEQPDTLTSVNNLAFLYQAQGRYSEAEPLYKRALAARERVLGPEHPDTLVSVNNLAFLYQAQGRYSEAEPFNKRALAARERLLGPEHPDTLRSVNNLGFLYKAQGRYGEAEPLIKRALAGWERVLGPEHPNTLLSMSNLGELYYLQHDWARAAQLLRRSTTAIAGRVQRGVQNAAQALSGKKKSEAEQKSGEFSDLVKAVYRLAPEGRAPDAIASGEMFQTAQWAQSSEAAASLVQMAARGAKGDPKLAALARERQDALAEWQKRDALRNAALGQESAKRNPQAEADNNSRLDAIDTRIKEIDKELAAKFPDYAALASPAPLGLEDAQAQLGPDEALVFFLDTKEWGPTPEETFIWVVTKADVRWVRSDLGTKALAREVQALRCGLDAEAWADRPCADLTGQTYTEADREAGKPLPFDFARAHKLYRALFGEVEDLIKGKRLLIVPSGPLTQLPFQVLVKALTNHVPSGERLREVGLLGAQLKDLTPDERHTFNLPAGRGVKVVKTVLNSAAEAAGMKPDDILLSIDGEEYASTRNTVKAIQARAPGTKLQLRVLRAGAEVALDATLGGTTLREWVGQLLAPGEGKDVAWLIRDHALTVLPAVSSLKALRRVARPSAATKPMIGFGNPLLDGNQADAKYGTYFKKRAALARENQSCPQTPARTPMQRLASLFGLRRGVAPMAVRGLADVDFLKAQLPLPETRDELCAVARDRTPIRARCGLRARNRARGEGLERKRGAGAIPHRSFRHAWRAGRAIGCQGRAGPDPDAAGGGERGGRRLSHCVGDRSAEARRGLGDPVGLQHGGRRRDRGGGAVGARARVLLCAGPRVARLALGGGFRRDS